MRRIFATHATQPLGTVGSRFIRAREPLSTPLSCHNHIVHFLILIAAQLLWILTRCPHKLVLPMFVSRNTLCNCIIPHRTKLVIVLPLLVTQGPSPIGRKLVLTTAGLLWFWWRCSTLIASLAPALRLLICRNAGCLGLLGVWPVFVWRR